jgi:peptidyl-prolyl cis-trans isomerase A (cyclophilin A)
MTRFLRLSLSASLLCLGLTYGSGAWSADPLHPRVRVNTTLGSFVIELDAERAPLTAKHFLEIVRSGHFNGTIFHRVVAGFLAQGGGYDPKLQLKPAPATVVNESGNGLSNTRGTVGMARTGDPHSADAQFYVNLVDNTMLDPQPSRWGYTVFGRVVEGMTTVDEIGNVGTGGGGELKEHVPLKAIVIENAEVLP